MRAVNQIKYNRSTRNGAVIRYIVVHDTGNTARGANATAHYNYFNSGNRSSSADFFVDDTQILCVNDYRKYYTWHCGDGHGKYGITNANSVGVEFCINVGSNRERTIELCAKVVRELMEELNIPMERVVRHYDASRKNCPQSMSSNGWEQWYKFKEMLKGDNLTMSQYEELKNEISQLTDTVKILATELHNMKNPMIYNYIDGNMPKWAHEAVQWAVDSGIIRGTENGLELDDKDLRYIVMLKRIHDKKQ